MKLFDKAAVPDRGHALVLVSVNFLDTQGLPYPHPPLNIYPDQSVSKEATGGSMNTFSRIAAVVFCLVMSPACQKEVTESRETKEANDRIIQQLKSSLEQRFKDPGSVQYRNLSVRQIGQLPVLCGEVNAKNSFGGYIGYKPFIAGRGTFFTSVIGLTQADAERLTVGITPDDVTNEKD